MELVSKPEMKWETEPLGVFEETPRWAMVPRGQRQLIPLLSGRDWLQEISWEYYLKTDKSVNLCCIKRHL